MQLCFDQPDVVRAYFFALLEGMAAGILLADGEGKIQAVNSRAGELLGLTGSSVMQRCCWQVLCQYLHVDRQLVDKLQRPGGGVVFERSPQGGEQSMLCITRSELKSPFLALGGSFFLRIEDVGGRSMVEGQQERNRRLVAMQEMALGLNQELKNPLGGIELYASLLQRELADDPDNSRLASQILHAVRTMDSLLHTSLNFAALPEPPRMARIVVKQWLKEIVAKLRQLDRRRIYNFRLSVDLGQHEILGDRNFLDQLVLHGGMNAMESMVEGGEIVISCRLVADERGREFFALCLIDHGSGIAPVHMGKIFDPFFSTKNCAAGLGLPIVHFIVEAHHGYVRVESEEGKGTTLTVLLPALGR